MYLCFALFAILGCLADISVVPLMMWSPQRYFAGSNCLDQEAVGILSKRDVVENLQEISVKKSPVVLSFLQSKPVFRNIMGDLTPSTSCLAAPFVDLGGESMSQIVEETFQKSKIIKLGNSCDLALAGLQKTNIFSNSETSLILVRADDESFDAACLSRITKLVSSKTGNNFVSLLSSEEPTKISTEFSTPVVQARRLLSAVSASVTPPCSNATKLACDAINGVLFYDCTCSAPLQYVSTPIVMALIVVFLLLGLAWVGVSCLMAIEAPSRFGTENLAIAKEF